MLKPENRYSLNFYKINQYSLVFNNSIKISNEINALHITKLRISNGNVSLKLGGLSSSK